MKTIEEAHQKLTDLKFELDKNRNTLGEKIEMIGEFIDQDLEDIATQVDKAIDRIAELEGELQEAKDTSDEWEEKYNALV